MKTRAAVAWEAAKPLSIETIELEGPKAGEVLVEIMATGICHTDAYTLSGADSEGKFPAILGHEGAGIVREIGPGVTTVKVGEHVIPLYTPECRQCKTCLSRRSNLCTAIRATQGQGVMPDGTSRFRCDGDTVFHYMGCSTFSNFTVLPEIALAKVRDDAPFDKICYIGCGVTTGIGAVIYTAKVWPGANVAVFGLGGIGLNVIQGARMVGADKIVGIDLNPGKRAVAEKFGMTHFVNPDEVGRDKVVQAIVDLTGGGADFSFECIGNVHTMRQALECCHRGWGESIIIGVAEPQAARSRRDRSSSSPAACGAAPPSAARGGAPTCRRSSTGTWRERSTSTISSPTSCRLERINEGFDLMHEGKSIRAVVEF